MAQINSRNNYGSRIDVSDGVLIPHKKDKTLFSSWLITFAGAILILAYLFIYHPEKYRKIFKFIPDGILVTFQVTFLAILFASLIGLVIGLGQITRIGFIRTLSTIYVEVVRGIPLLVQLFYIYFALGPILRLEGIVSAVLAMAICYGAYIAEIFRGGILSIPKGQMEASLALGMTRFQALRHVIIPQTLRVILPAIGNEFIALLKDSSLVGILAISDLFRRGREYASKTFFYFESYTVIALVYLVLTLFLSFLMGLIEDRMKKHE
jgi:polar amino acid transport system permease protein